MVYTIYYIMYIFLLENQVFFRGRPTKESVSGRLVGEIKQEGVRMGRK